MKPEVQEYFNTAYTTGSDIWTHIPYRYRAESMLPRLEKDALILDIGAGRGIWMMKLVGLGYRVLGIDYASSIVNKVNKNIQEEGYTDRARMVLGNVLDIPFVDESFDMLTDIGTMQHISTSDWEQYLKEVVRVLKPSGYYLNVSLSRKTKRLFGWEPEKSSDGDFEKFGVIYHFFSEQEIKNLFSNDFEIIGIQHETYPSQSDPDDEITLIFSLMQKK